MLCCTVNTKVDVRFDIEKAKWIPNHLKPILREKHNTRITKEGEFFIQSDKTRSQTITWLTVWTRSGTSFGNSNTRKWMLHRKMKPSSLTGTVTFLFLSAIEARSCNLGYRQRKAAAERLREKRDNSLKKEARRMDNF